MTTGDFCGEGINDGQSQLYTVYFDITFNQPFTSSQVITASGQTSPAAVYVSFGTATPVVDAKVGISFVSTANAALNWQTENPGWNFDAVKAAAQNSWDQLLGKIKVSGGSYSKTQEFYSLLYKDFIQPKVTSDVNGQFMGADEKVHTLAAGSGTSTACTPAGTSTTRSPNCRPCSTRRPHPTRRSRRSTTTRRTASSSSGATTRTTTT